MGTTMENLLANYNPTGFAQGNQQQAANIDLTGAQTKGVQANTGLTQQATQEAQLKNQIAQQQLKDQQILQQIYSQYGHEAAATATPTFLGGNGTPAGIQSVSPNPQSTAASAPNPMSATSGAPARPTVPDPIADPVGFAMFGARAGLSAPTVQSLLQSGIERKKAMLQLPPEQIKAEQAVLQPVQDSLFGYMNTPEADPSRAQKYAATYQAIQKLDPQIAAAMPQPNPQGPPQNADLMHVVGIAHGLQTWFEQQEAQAKAGQAGAETALTQAKTPGAQATSDIDVMKANAMKSFAQNPQTAFSSIDQILPPSGPYGQLNRALKVELQDAMSRGDLEAAKAVVPKAADYVQQISKETDPNVTANRIQEAVQTEVAAAPYKVAQSVATAKALRMGDNPAVAGVAPAAVGQVQNQAIKLDQDYAGAKAATETLGHVLDLADRGNAAAGANVASLGAAGIAAVNGIKRLNPSLVEGYGNAGSILQDIQGKLSHWEGKGPLSPDLLDEIRELHQAIGQQSYQTYTDSLNSLNQRTGAKFGPTLGAPNISKNVGATAPIVQHSPSTGQYRYSIDGGKTWQPGQLPNRQ